MDGRASRLGVPHRPRARVRHPGPDPAVRGDVMVRTRDDQVAVGHGAAPRGLDAQDGVDPPRGRFGRMFPGRPACEADPEAIEQLVALMERPRNLLQNHDLPAGFTYLAQFVDHDITFDPTTLADRERDPQALVNFRTPRLDLDSVYGLGPTVQPYLYDWTETTPRGTRLLVGRNRHGVDDLPRNHQGRALVGDPRNDEHAIIAQLHLLFIRFHNAVVDHLAEAGSPGRELFEAARRSVRRHYRHIVAGEFLTAIVGRDVMGRVLAPGGRELFTWDEEPFIPVEFSGA